MLWRIGVHIASAYFLSYLRVLSSRSFATEAWIDCVSSWIRNPGPHSFDNTTQRKTLYTYTIAYEKSRSPHTETEIQNLFLTIHALSSARFLLSALYPIKVSSSRILDTETVHKHRTRTCTLWHLLLLPFEPASI